MSQFLGGLDRNRAHGIALLRIVTGLILFHAGYSKVFVSGLPHIAQSFQGMGIIMPQITGPFIGLLELAGGAALTLGLFTRYLGVIFAIQFIVAAYVKFALLHKGIAPARIDILLVVIGLVLATSGGGSFSLGGLLKRGS